MSNRSAKFASALVAGILAGVNFSAMAQNAATSAQAKPAETKTADNCQSAPKGAAPAGSHWYYHLDRAKKTKCWYLGEAKNKSAKNATAQQQPAAPETTAAAATPPQPPAQPQPQQPQPAMSKTVADAHAEWPSPQATTMPAPATEADQAGSTMPAPAPNAPGMSAGTDAQSSARWLDSTSMAGANGTRHAAPQPTPVAQPEAPQQAAPPAPAQSAAVEAPPEKASASTQMLLVVMVGALALAGLVSALVVKLTRRRTPAYDTHGEQRAPWDSIHIERAPPMQVSRERPIRLSELPPRRESPTRDLDQTAEDSRQIAAMLQRLARSAAN